MAHWTLATSRLERMEDLASESAWQALERVCDSLAYRSLDYALDQLGKATPLVITYIESGLKGAVLKANLRLWDRSTISPAAAIKIVRHNLHRPTALIHESGHQFAHIVGWTGELAATLEEALAAVSPQLRAVWAGWASEIAADTFAFAHTGLHVGPPGRFRRQRFVRDIANSALRNVTATQPNEEIAEGGKHRRPMGVRRLRRCEALASGLVTTRFTRAVRSRRFNFQQLLGHPLRRIT